MSVEHGRAAERMFIRMVSDRLNFHLQTEEIKGHVYLDKPMDYKDAEICLRRLHFHDRHFHRLPKNKHVQILKQIFACKNIYHPISWKSFYRRPLGRLWPKWFHSQTNRHGRSCSYYGWKFTRFDRHTAYRPAPSYQRDKSLVSLAVELGRERAARLIRPEANGSKKDDH